MKKRLAQKICIPCKKGTPALKDAQKHELLTELDNWELVDNHHLSKEFHFKDFAQGLEFVNNVAEIAEEQNHHPDIYLAWGQVRLDIWTHTIDNLVEADFILAAKVDQLKQELGSL